MPKFGYIGWVAYEERLGLPWWWWLVGALLVASLAVAVFAYVPFEVGIAITIFFLVGIGAVLYGYGRLDVRVDDDGLSVGRNAIAAEWIAGAEALEGAQAVSALGPEAEVRDFLRTRPYIPDLVRIRIDDPADPHPHWMVSTRRPQELAGAINAMSRGQA